MRNEAVPPNRWNDRERLAALALTHPSPTRTHRRHPSSLPPFRSEVSLETGGKRRGDQRRAARVALAAGGHPSRFEAPLQIGDKAATWEAVDDGRRG